MLITEIAKKAKVSPATVSRAINQPQIVAPESLARIRSVMEKHNYVPAPLARRRGPKVRSADQRRIGVWFVGARANNPSLNWFQDQLIHVQSTDTRYRVDLRVLFSTTPDELPAGLAGEKLDGLIIQGMEPAAACLAKLRDLPHVWFMTRRSPTFPADYVEPNNEENGRLAADYLAEKGHKAVAVISTDPDYSAVSRRVKAFLERAAELKLTVHSILGTSTAKATPLSASSSPPRRAPPDSISPSIIFAARSSAPCARPARSPAATSRPSSATSIRSSTTTSTTPPLTSTSTCPRSCAKSSTIFSGAWRTAAPRAASASRFPPRCSRRPTAPNSPRRPERPARRRSLAFPAPLHPPVFSEIRKSPKPHRR
jgi:DNA-binding LacI/PurR family transcriptional regulator